MYIIPQKIKNKNLEDKRSKGDDVTLSSPTLVSAVLETREDERPVTGGKMSAGQRKGRRRLTGKEMSRKRWKGMTKGPRLEGERTMGWTG